MYSLVNSPKHLKGKKKSTNLKKKKKKKKPF